MPRAVRVTKARLQIVLALTAMLGGTAAGALLAQRSDAFGASRNHPAIAYSEGGVDDAVARLNGQLRTGATTLRFDSATGYLRAVLDALGVEIESQILVFSQTSSQAPLISMANPRAVYFNDQVAVGWVRGGDVLEVAAQDPRQGTIFYTLPQSSTGTLGFTRNETCLRCHLSWETRAVPGPFVLTTHPRKTEGEYANGGIVDHRDPMMNRWGGWYITGTLVPPRHMGNQAMLRPDATDPQHTPPPPRHETMAGQFDLRDYPSPYSDVVALLVLEHQAHLTNLMTRAGWEARVADGPGGIGGGTHDGRELLPNRVREAVDELVDYMLFVDEAPLPGKVAGSSGFAERFSARGPRDDRGRSLRDFELDGRLMRYPLSYMIYTPAFAGLPDQVKAAAYNQLWRILSGEVHHARYEHLTLARRQAVVEILRATKPDLPDYFRPVTP